MSVTSIHTKPNAPVMTVVRQEKSVLSWQVPLLIDESGGVLYNDTSRTLCEDNYQNSTLSMIYNGIAL